MYLVSILRFSSSQFLKCRASFVTFKKKFNERRDIPEKEKTVQLQTALYQNLGLNFSDCSSKF